MTRKRKPPAPGWGPTTLAEGDVWVRPVGGYLVFLERRDQNWFELWADDGGETVWTEQASSLAAALAKVDLWSRRTERSAA